MSQKIQIFTVLGTFTGNWYFKGHSGSVDTPLPSQYHIAHIAVIRSEDITNKKWPCGVTLATT